MSLPEALALCAELEPLRLEYYEDPTWGLEGMASLRRRLRTPLAGNMCVVDFNDLSSGIRLGAFDVVLDDVFCFGGLSAFGELAAICRTFGLDLVIHSWHQLWVATAANLHLAASIPHVTRVIDSTLPLHTDVVAEGKLPIRDGMLSVPDGPGLGVSLDDASVARHVNERWDTGVALRFAVHIRWTFAGVVRLWWQDLEQNSAWLRGARNFWPHVAQGISRRSGV